MRPNVAQAGVFDWRNTRAVAGPSANRAAETLSGYAAAPPLAFPGWRLTVPGAPPGGQYHGFEAIGNRAPLSPQMTPWLKSQRGVALSEGETMSGVVPDYVYRSPSEMRPRANASGPTNAIESFQEAKEVGFAEVPGAYGGSYHRSAVAPKGSGMGLVAVPIMRPVGNPVHIVEPLPVRGVISPVTSPITSPSGPGSVGVSTPPYSGPWNPWQTSGGGQPISPSPVVNAPPSAFSPVTAEPYSCQNPDPQCISAGETCGPFPNGCMPYSESNPDPRCVSEGATGGPWPSCSSDYNLNNPDPKCTAAGMTGGPYPNCTALPAVNTSGIDTATNDPACLQVGMTGGPYPNCTPTAAGAGVAVTGAVPSTGIEAWLSESSIIPGVSNLLVAGGAILAVMLLKRK